MAKVVTIRERVHQPFFDTLVRTSGMAPGSLSDTTALFTNSSAALGGVRDQSTTNLLNGSTLPSDQSHVVLALRVFTWFRNPILRITNDLDEVSLNGDYGSLTQFLVGGLGFGNAPGTIQDVYRLHWQVEEQLHWSFGTGLKNSLENMPTWYFPTGGGISGDMGAATDLIHWQNSGYDGHAGILRLARAILLPPRQNILTNAQIFALPDFGNAALFGTTQGARNMLSLRDNLNAVDLVSKVITFTFDGLFSRDVQ
ncbi:MAG: hypothetical protein ACE5FJ_05570 [Gemmatimonadales bacterium]